MDVASISPNVSYYDAQTHQPSDYWNSLTTPRQLELIHTAITESEAFRSLVTVVETGPGGQVVVSLTQPLSAAKRGEMLLGLEELLKHSVDIGINIWCKPIDDKSAIRKLRGIRVEALRIRTSTDMTTGDL